MTSSILVVSSKLNLHAKADSNEKRVTISTNQVYRNMCYFLTCVFTQNLFLYMFLPPVYIIHSYTANASWY